MGSVQRRRPRNWEMGCEGPAVLGQAAVPSHLSVYGHSLPVDTPFCFILQSRASPILRRKRDKEEQCQAPEEEVRGELGPLVHGC